MTPADPAQPPRARSGTVARSDDLRGRHLGLVLREVHRDGALSRAALTQRLQMSRSTVGSLVADLCQLELLTESVPVRGNRAGRPSHVVRPRPGGPYAVAVDLGVERVTVAAVPLGGGLALRRSTALRVGDRAAGAAVEVVARAVEDAVATMPAPSWPIGLGVGVPGTVRAADGFVESAANLGWREEPFGAMLRRRLPALRVVVANDADMGMLAEHLRGAARDAEDAVYLIGKAGIGAGILTGGRRLAGVAGLAGEVGHMVLHPAGRRCHCGGRGCAEGLIGAETLLRSAGRTGPFDAQAVAAVFADARAGDSGAMVGVGLVAHPLGLLLANLVNLLNPQVIVLAGTLAEVFAVAADQVLAGLDGQAVAAARATVEVRVSLLAEDAIVLGAAELALQHLIDDPLTALAAARDEPPSSSTTSE